MAWSITVNKPGEVTSLTRFHEEFGRLNPMYPVDMDLALGMAKSLELGSVTLSGGRTPVTGSDDEVVVITITGSAKSSDFLGLMQRIVKQGPDADSAVGRHYAAVNRLREHPCRHEFAVFDTDPPGKICLLCDVHESGGLFWYDD